MLNHSYNNKPKLTYFRCTDCLTAFTSFETVKECICGGKVELMGTVSGVKYTRLEDLTPCDDRCTGASGPSCNCQCGGEHHGTGRTVQTVVEQGVVKVSHMHAKAKVEQGTAYRELLAKAEQAYQARYGETANKILNRVWVEREEYFNQRNAHSRLRTIQAGRQFKSRQADLERFIQSLEQGSK